MKNSLKFIFGLVTFFFVGCSSEQSLQEYFIDNKENPNFIAIDIPASILKIDEAALTDKQKKAMASLKKLNLLAFNKTETNTTEYTLEKAAIKEILKNDDFIELMKFNSKYGKGVIKYLGDDDAIDEVIIYGDRQEQGFVLVRVLGNNMNPADAISLVNAMEKSKYNGEGLEEIAKLLKK